MLVRATHQLFRLHVEVAVFDNQPDRRRWSSMKYTKLVD
jgi:hypothetical protein